MITSIAITLFVIENILKTKIVLLKYVLVNDSFMLLINVIV